MKNKNILKFIILIFLGWRISLTLISFISYTYFPNPVNEANIVRHQEKMGYWGSWSNWDGGHFLGISENGYLPKQTVFFPAYPLAIKLLTLFGISSLLSGLLISHLSLIGSLFLLYKLVLLDFNKKIAKRTVIAMLIFPTSFFYAAVYSEALFLLAATGALYFARTKHFGLASLFASLAVGTRIIGIAVVFGILTEYLSQNRNILNKKVFYIFSSLLPLWLFIIYQYYLFQNSLGFLINEFFWGKQLSLPWQPVLNYFQKVNFSKFFEISNNAFSIHEFLFLIIGITGLIYTYKKLHKSYFVYFLFAFMVPLFSGSLSSFPRFLIIIFPIYICMALVKNKFISILGIIFFSTLAVYYLGRFINNLWVS